MSEPRADTALRALAELRVPEAVTHVDARQRREIVARLDHLQRASSGSGSRYRWVWLSVAALVSSVVAAAVLVLFDAETGAPVTNPRTHRAANDPLLPPPIVATGTEQRMSTGSEVKTNAGSSVQLRTSLGARISVGGSSELRLAEGRHSGSDERVDLTSGSIRVKVPKLGAHRQFRVSTPDTLVIVHGTEFSVTVRNDARGRPNTVVEVTSGRVEVRKKQRVEFLDAGAAWSSEATTTSMAQPVPKQLAREPAAPAMSTRTATEASRGTPPGGSLVRANALLRSALEASRQGRDALALARLDELLTRYPDSPVADNARVERFRVLKRLGREREAARAASGYLEGDPDGFARDEARSLGK